MNQQLLMNRRKNVVVLGSYNASIEELDIANQLGVALSKRNINVLCGGQKGVMKSLCESISKSRQITPNCLCLIVGILPTNDFSSCNEYVDVAIPTGASSLQNSILPTSGDAVIVIGGSAGTLTELSFAWQYKKPIALIGNCGWAQKLANQKLDSRRDDIMVHHETVSSIINWLDEIIE